MLCSDANTHQLVYVCIEEESVAPTCNGSFLALGAEIAKGEEKIREDFY